MELCFLVGGVPADGDVAVEHARRLAARHAVTVALCDGRPPGAVAARAGQPRVVALDEALDQRYDVVVAFDWIATVQLFAFDAARHVYYVDAFAHEQLPVGEPRRIAAQLSYDLPVDFLAGAPWVARVLAEIRPEARCLAATHGVARGDDDGAGAGDALVVVAGDPLPDVLAGRVVVASSALPGIDDVIRHGENGFLVEPDDDRGAQRFVALVAGDDALRERMSAAARATPWPDPDEAAEAMDGALRALVAEPAPDAARWPVRLMADAMAGVAVFGTEHAALQTRLQRVDGDEIYPGRVGACGVVVARRAPPAARASAPRADRRQAAPMSAAARARVAFVGPRAQAWPFVLDEPTAAIEPRLVDFRAGDPPARVTAALDEFAPDVVVALAPDELPAGLFAGVPARTVALLTGSSRAALEQLDASNFDRVVALDPGLAASADGAVWRSLAPPVNDAIFAAVAPPADGRFAFFGHWTPRRERFLVESKHAFDLLHVDTGAVGDRLLELYATTSVAVNIHAGEGLAFEHRVPMHLAAGHLLVSEPLKPLRGLEPGLDFLEARTPRELTTILGGVRDVPELHHRVRLRGRRKAEQFRASAVYERLFGDLERDLAAFGSQRESPRAR